MSNDPKAAEKAGKQPAIAKTPVYQRKWQSSRSSAISAWKNRKTPFQCFTRTAGAELSSITLAIIAGEQFSRGETIERAVAYYSSGHSRLADILVIRIYDRRRIENKKSCVAIQLRDLENSVLAGEIDSISGQRIRVNSVTEFPK